jgi:hypothetical protein
MCPRREEDVRLHIVLLGFLLVACASAASTRVPGGDRDILMAAEIEHSNAGTLYEAIQRLRPHFLFSRGRSSLRTANTQQPVVVVNGVPQSSLESLRGISARTVHYVRFLSAPEATTRFGTGYMAGVIEVALR